MLNYDNLFIETDKKIFDLIHMIYKEDTDNEQELEPENDSESEHSVDE